MCFPKLHFATFTGKAVNPVAPTVDMICLEDIATALSNNCRWGGHTEVPYSIAQHSVMVMAALEIFLGKDCTDEMRRQALIHDASEAYMCDIPAPLKQQMPEYEQIEEGLQKVIAERFGLLYPWHQYVHAADKASMVVLEAPICGKERDWFSYYDETEPYKSWIKALEQRTLPMLVDKVWTAPVAKSVFLEAAKHLKLS